MESLKLVGYRFSPATQKVLFVAKESNATLSLHNLPWGSTERESLKTNSPTLTFPYLETTEGTISEAGAIVNFLAETFKPELLGNNAFEKAQVAQWSLFNIHELSTHNRAVVYPLFGWAEYNKTDADAGLKAVKEHFKTLNKHLEGKQYFVGNHLTLADIDLFFNIRFYFIALFNEDVRSKAYPNVTAWFNNIANSEAAVYAVGHTVLCKTPQKYPPKAEKKEEPKPVAKKEKTEGDDEEPKKTEKPKNPLDLLPPSSFVLDDFKRDFLNAEDKKAALEKFWQNIDYNGYSFWFMEYQKLPSEGKILFKTNNSCSMFLQKLDHFRKYSFGVHGVYGEEGNYDVRGVWLWRGTDIPAEVREHDAFEYTTIKKLEPQNNAADKELVDTFWLNLNAGDIVDGKPVAQTNYFK